MTLRTALLAAALAALPLTAADAAPPPAGAMDLSALLAAFEAATPLAFIEEVQWDDDGYWEVEYRTEDGREHDVKLDPMTGAPR